MLTYTEGGVPSAKYISFWVKHGSPSGSATGETLPWPLKLNETNHRIYLKKNLTNVPPFCTMVAMDTAEFYHLKKTDFYICYYHWLFLCAVSYNLAPKTQFYLRGLWNSWYLTVALDLQAETRNLRIFIMMIIWLHISVRETWLIFLIHLLT